MVERKTKLVKCHFCEEVLPEKRNICSTCPVGANSDYCDNCLTLYNKKYYCKVCFDFHIIT